jgi:hypothetical protein
LLVLRPWSHRRPQPPLLDGCPIESPDGPNSALDELGPSYVEVGGRALLYFSSGPDIYVSERLSGSDGMNDA